MMNDRRESRSVLAYTLPKPYTRCRSETSRRGRDSGGRPTSTATAGHLHLLVAVLREERLLEARLTADEIGEVVPGRDLDHRSDRAVDVHAQPVVVHDHVAHAG